MSALTRRMLGILPPPLATRLRRAKLMSALQRERFSRSQRRTNAMITVPGIVRRPRKTGTVWGVCLARNEEDIIAHTVGHMLAQGLDGVIVVDNLSTDGTRAVLDSLAAEDARVHVGTDAQVGFHQGGKTSYLAHLAWLAGADWVVPFDADEFWFAERGSVASFLASVSADSVWCDFRNVFPTVEAGSIDLTVPAPVQVELRENAWLRVCFRARRWVWVGEGNHALRDGVDPPLRGLHMLHYSYRSIDQYSRKVDHGVAALAAAGKDVTIARHWRHWAAIAPRDRETLWRSYLAGSGVPADDPTPVRERITVEDPTQWTTWDPHHVFS